MFAMVNFMGLFDSAVGSSDILSNIILDISVSAFWKEIYI
jgi:hypothetical protein